MFGKKFEITEAQIKKLNSLLPKELQRNEFDKTHFDQLYPSYLFENFENFINNRKTAANELHLHIQSKNEEKAKLIQIFNTELFEALPLGMIDVGVVKKFTTASTGDRFSNGMIGYAIEGAFDETWAKSNSQFKAVEDCKLELLKKAISIYPECNMLFKFQVDFRELGSSGNVFIYMRGTAAKGNNDPKQINKNKINQNINMLTDELEDLKNEILILEENLKLIPKTVKEISEKLI